MLLTFYLLCIFPNFSDVCRARLAYMEDTPLVSRGQMNAKGVCGSENDVASDALAAEAEVSGGWRSRQGVPACLPGHYS